MSKDIDPALLRKLLRYEPETGKLFWLERTQETGGKTFRNFNAKFAGKEALYGTSSSNGYPQGSVLGRQYLAHRVIWALLNGYWPVEIDHENGNRTDCRKENLREVSRRENCLNKRMTSRNNSGRNGVYWAKHAGRWRSEIQVSGKRRHLGYFDTIDAAFSARLKAEKEAGYHINHGRKS